MNLGYASRAVIYGASLFQIPKSLRLPVSAAALLGTLAAGSDRPARQSSSVDPAHQLKSGLAGEDFPELRASEPGDSVAHRLRAYAGELRTRGYAPRDFSFGQHLCTENMLSFVLLQVYIENPGIKVVDQNPAQSFTYDYEANARASSEIVGRIGGKINLSPLSVEVEKVERDPGKSLLGGVIGPQTILKVKMFDRLSGGADPIAQFEIDPEAWGSGSRLRREAEIQTALRRPRWERIVADSLVKKSRLTEIVTESRHEPALPDGVTVVGLHLTPRGSAHDSPHKVILVNSVKKPGPSLDAEGQIDFLIVRVAFNKEEAAQGRLLPLRRAQTGFLMPPWQDKFGNTITCGQVSKPGPGGEITVDFNIQPKAAAMYGPSRLVPVRIDLSRVGVAETIVPVSMRSLEIVDDEAVPRIITSMSAPKVQSELGASIGELRRGVVEASLAMGFSDRPAVDDITIHESRGENGFFDPANPQGIIIYDKLLRLNPESARSVARHECLHLIDDRYGKRLSGGRFSEFWYELHSKDNPNRPALFSLFSGGGFFRGLDEKNFGKGIGGHSADGPAEFFASFCNSLLDDNWESAIAAQSLEFRRSYYLACRALEAQLKSQSDFPKSAPIFDLLAQRSAEIVRKSPGVIGISGLGLSPWAPIDSSTVR